MQFINIIDFMMVMPLGPDFATELGISTAHIGWIGGSYTAAAAISALIGALFLDRFDRRKALTLAMFGLAAGTAAGAFAQGLVSLLAARIVAGIFGGPATSLAIAIVVDQVPVERRGRVLGAVMGAFSIAAVLGVPAALELAQHIDWRAPFIAVAASGLIVAFSARALLPPLRHHIGGTDSHHVAQFLSLFTRRSTLLAYTTTGCGMGAAFLIIPNISAFLQFNMSYPREHLGMLYLAGGALSFFAMRYAGHFVDRHGSPPVAAVGTVLLLCALFIGYYLALTQVPVIVVFVVFMVAMAIRNVATSTQLSHIPAPHERARFMSANSAMQNLAAAGGAGLSSQLLDAAPNGALIGMPRVAVIAMLCAALLPFLLYHIERLTRSAPAAN